MARIPVQDMVEVDRVDTSIDWRRQAAERCVRRSTCEESDEGASPLTGLRSGGWQRKGRSQVWEMLRECLSRWCHYTVRLEDRESVENCHIQKGHLVGRGEVKVEGL
ncbi:hypothetical protein EYF80_036797 [Liparis tanakae]|uniref:Uncharacterized protein n=1 Tax=Liparis tanakae TaxID=230148 RepID=A0A4Z2GHH2_9TELE|nr:hypothetical protein EYF80_036797 [Liparis tanakae]